MPNIFPTSFTDKTTLVDWDKVLWYDSETATPEVDWNKNFAMSELKTYVASWIDSDDISEWASNLYYTDARVNTVIAAKYTDDISEWITNKYASTTNVDSAWAVMNTDTTTVSMAFVVDEDDMVSNSVTKVPTQQSVKAYADTLWAITWEIKLWVTDTAPANWLIANWSAISRTTYSDLFTLIGTTYWIWDWSTTFNIPDLRGNTPVWKDWATFTALWDTWGTETHTLTIDEIPAHTHTVDTYTSSWAADATNETGTWTVWTHRPIVYFNLEKSNKGVFLLFLSVLYT